MGKRAELHRLMATTALGGALDLYFAGEVVRGFPVAGHARDLAEEHSRVRVGPAHESAASLCPRSSCYSGSPPPPPSAAIAATTASRVGRSSALIRTFGLPSKVGGRTSAQRDGKLRHRTAAPPSLPSALADSASTRAPAWSRRVRAELARSFTKLREEGSNFLAYRVLDAVLDSGPPAVAALRGSISLQRDILRRSKYSSNDAGATLQRIKCDLEQILRLLPVWKSNS